MEGSGNGGRLVWVDIDRRQDQGRQLWGRCEFEGCVRRGSSGAASVNNWNCSRGDEDVINRGSFSLSERIKKLAYLVKPHLKNVTLINVVSYERAMT
jgi:hypothetical protein